MSRGWWLVAGVPKRAGLALVVLCFLCAGAAAASGCGYTLAGRGSFLPASIRTIGVPTFSNRTSVFNLETTLTQKVIAEFIGRGKYTILPQATDVDAVLTGEVSAVTIAPSSLNSQQIASRYAITIVANVQLRDRENKLLWENPSLIFRQDYDNTSGSNAVDATAFFGQETNALDRVTSDFARAVVAAILEAF
jgi:Lipopolysaccharide-assembly